MHPNQHDAFKTSNKWACTKGLQMTFGWAKFVKGDPYGIADWGKLFCAEDLYATRGKPKDWQDDGAVYRYIVSEYACCCKPDDYRCDLYPCPLGPCIMTRILSWK